MTDTVRDATHIGEAIRIDYVPRQGLLGLALTHAAPSLPVSNVRRGGI